MNSALKLLMEIEIFKMETCFMLEYIENQNWILKPFIHCYFVYIHLPLKNFLVRKLHLSFQKLAKNFLVYADPYRRSHSMWHLSISVSV